VSNVAIIAWFAVKPEAVIVIASAVVVPTAPVEGVTAIEGVCELIVVDCALENESLATIVCDVVVNEGMLKVWINCPALIPVPKAAVPMPGGDIPSIARVGRLTPAFWAKPEPTRNTVVPTAAVAGYAVSVGAPVFVNIAVPEFPVVVIVCAPAPAGAWLIWPAVVGGLGHALADS